jgi:hypothetical protein
VEHLASDADRVPPDGEQSRPGPEPDPAAYSADGDGHASSDWERIYLATRPKRLAGASGQQGAPKGLVNVVEQHARESADQDELARRRDLAAEARDRTAPSRIAPREPDTCTPVQARGGRGGLTHFSQLTSSGSIGILEMDDKCLAGAGCDRELV